MAKKKAKKKTTRRRRRIGAMALNPSSMMMKYGSIILGYLVAATPIQNAVDKALVGVTDLEKKKGYEKMIYGGLTLGGAYFQFMDKSKSSMIKTVVAGVAVGAGLKNALRSFGIGRIGGYGNVPALGGYGNVPALGNGRIRGYVPQSTLNGGMGSYTPQSTLNGRNVMGNARKSGEGDGNGTGSGLIGGSCLMG